MDFSPFSVDAGGPHAEFNNQALNVIPCSVMTLDPYRQIRHEAEIGPITAKPALTT